MNSHIVTYNTGFPAPGIGMFYTQEHISKKLRELKENPFESGTIDVPYFLDKGQPKKAGPVVRGGCHKPRRTPIPRDLEKTCKYEGCGKTFFANNKETLCSAECRALWKKEYNRQWHKRKATPVSKPQRPAPERGSIQVPLL